MYKPFIVFVSAVALGCSSNSPQTPQSAEAAATRDTPRPEAKNVSLRLLADDANEEPVDSIAPGNDFVVKGEFFAVGEGHLSILTVKIVNDRNVAMDEASARPKSTGDFRYQFSAELSAPSNGGQYSVQTMYQRKRVAEQRVTVR